MGQVRFLWLKDINKEKQEIVWIAFENNGQLFLHVVAWSIIDHSTYNTCI